MFLMEGLLGAVLVSAVIGNPHFETAGTARSENSCSGNQCPKSFFTNDDLVITPQKDCYEVGDVIGLTCPAGAFNGPPENTCTDNFGTRSGWKYPASTCEVFTCDPPLSKEALNVDPDPDEETGTYPARSDITYSCTQGYSLTGSNEATCDSQNTWNPSTVPTCLQICEKPVIENGGLSDDDSFNDGDTVTVICNEGYDLPPGSSSNIKCSDGAWDNIPTCYAECAVPGTSNSDYPEDTTIKHLQSMIISCDEGTSYEQLTSYTVTCMDGSLQGTKPTACYADCDELNNPENGAQTGGNMHGETVTFTCDRGYSTNDTTTDVCTNGSWNDNITTPTCYAKSLENSITLYCNPDKFIVEIPGALLGNPEDLTKLKLGDCSANYYDGEYVYINSSYTECDTTAEVNQISRTIIYRNRLFNTDIGIITVDSAVTIDVACVFDQDNMVSSTAIIEDGLSNNLEQGGRYEVVFAAYQDDTYQTVITENDRVDPAQLIYIRAEVNYVDEVDLFPTRCFATPQPSNTYYIYEDLVTEGCSEPSNDYASDLSTETSDKANFGFAMEVFRFTDTDSDSLYIHCDLKVCPIPESGESPCPLPGSCSANRRKRSSQLTITRHVFAGPIRIGQDGDADDGSLEMTALAVYSVTVSAVLLGVVAILMVVMYRRRTQYSGLKRVQLE